MTLSPELRIMLRGEDLAGLGLPPMSTLQQLDDSQLYVMLVDAANGAYDQLGVMASDAPMATMLLWVDDDAPCDQRRQVKAGAEEALTVIGGGNRGGKTFGAFLLDVAFALGGDHPMVAEWLRINDLPPDLVPFGPGEVIVSAPSAGSSRRDHRPIIATMLPRHAQHWVGRNALAEAYVDVDVPGYDRPARIWFKSHDQGHRAYKGSQARRYHIDEDPEGAEGKLVLEECMRGASAVGGAVSITATPQNGRTWVTDELMERGKYGAKTYKIDTLGNYLVQDYEALKRWIEHLPPDEQRMRRFGDVVDRRGLVYTRWSRGSGDRYGPGCTCAPFDIPADWPRFRGGDFGLSNPTSVVWGALGDDDTLYVYRVLYADHLDGEYGDPHRERAPETYEEIGERVHQLEGAHKTEKGIWRGHAHPIERSWGDPSAAQALKTWRRMDLPFSKATNDVAAGISKVHSRMRDLDDGRPRLKVFDDCMPLIHELESYRRDPKRRDGAPLKKDDHAVDALRYLVMGVERWLGR